MLAVLFRQCQFLFAILLLGTGRIAFAQPTLDTLTPARNRPAAVGDADGSHQPLASVNLPFAEWKALCAKLPSNRMLRGRLPRKGLLPLQKFQEFDAVLTAFFEQCTSGTLAQTNFWLPPPPGARTFFNTRSAYFASGPGAGAAIPFEPYAQKLVVPLNAEVFFHADLHGDIRSLLAEVIWLNEHDYLRGFSVSRTNFHMVFLGDYTDRGAYGVEVLYTLFRLKLANPENVWLLRGNHEDFSMQGRYGFLEEGEAKYGADFDARRLVRAYDFFPVVLYLGTGEDFIQCHHGGLEPGFDPRPLLAGDAPVRFQFLGPLNQRRFLTEHPGWFPWVDAGSRERAAQALRDYRPEDPINPSPIGFMWNDFSLLTTDPQFVIDPRRALVYGQRATEYVLGAASTESRRVQAIFRGHQQSSAINPMMCRLLAGRGVFRHWEDADSSALLKASANELADIIEHAEERAIPPKSLWTFNVSPDSVYGEGCGYDFDAFGILKLAKSFADWRLRVVNVKIER